MIIFRTATARGKAEQADIAALHARDDGKVAVSCAKEYGGDLVPATSSITAAIEGKNSGAEIHQKHKKSWPEIRQSHFLQAAQPS